MGMDELVERMEEHGFNFCQQAFYRHIYNGNIPSFVYEKGKWKDYTEEDFEYLLRSVVCCSCLGWGLDIAKKINYAIYEKRYDEKRYDAPILKAYRERLEQRERAMSETFGT